MEPIELSNSTTSEIKSVFTTPRNRNQGLMEGLLRKIEEYVEGEDIDELRIGTHPENEPMRKLAEKLDYELESLGEEYGARYVKQIR
jgi:RimJ/RimL family protein N-acetyltransferase